MNREQTIYDKAARAAVEMIEEYIPELRGFAPIGIMEWWNTEIMGLG